MNVSAYRKLIAWTESQRELLLSAKTGKEQRIEADKLRVLVARLKAAKIRKDRSDGTLVTRGLTTVHLCEQVLAEKEELKRTALDNAVRHLAAYERNER